MKTRHIIAAVAPAALGRASNDPASSNTVLSVEGPQAGVLAITSPSTRADGTATFTAQPGTVVLRATKQVCTVGTSPWCPG